jgi:hypothetical protein
MALHRVPLPDDPSDETPFPLVGLSLWHIDGLELRYSTSVKWGDLVSISDLEEGGLPWLVLYFNP